MIMEKKRIKEMLQIATTWGVIMTAKQNIVWASLFAE